MDIRDYQEHVFNIIGFAAVIFVLFKIYKHFATSYLFVVDSNRILDYIETLIKRVEKQIERVEERLGIWREEELEHEVDLLRDYARRVAILSYDILSEINAGNYLARRSLEAMQSTEGWYEGHRVMLE